MSTNCWRQNSAVFLDASNEKSESEIKKVLSAATSPKWITQE